MSDKNASKKEEVAEVLKKQISGASAETEAERSEAEKLLVELGRSVEEERKELQRIKENACTSTMMKFEKSERELFKKLETSREEARRELDELHSTLGKYEEKTRYKDEAERELETLEEVKMMLGKKTKELAGRIEKLRVRRNSNLTKLFSEAKELEEEVRRSGEETLDFEREYTKLLGIMGKLSG